MWKMGPDPVRHQKHIAWLKARAQARFRDEPWRLTFSAWERLWQDHWHLRGRGRDCVMLVRKSWHRAWEEHNCEIVTRREFHARQMLIKVENGTIAPHYKARYEKI